VELINSTRMVTGYTMATEPSGRDLLVVVVKGTFEIPEESGATLRLSHEQLPLVMSDVFYGEPGISAPKYEVDFAPSKPRCDVLLNGSAYAPGGRPSERVTVGLSVGQWSKSFRVLGDRIWTAKGLAARPSNPQPFEIQPFSYDTAFGGVDNRQADAARHAAYMRNPAGRGFIKHSSPQSLDGTPVANTEELNRAIADPTSEYAPMSFGPIGRHWEPRVRFAGTYDEAWVNDVFPFLPADFDQRYFQAASTDQQLEIPVGEQSITLLNLSPHGRVEFVVPHFEAPVHVFTKSGGREDLTAHLDTVLIEPDDKRVALTWRIARPLKRNMFEIAQVLVGRKGQEWWQQREDIAFRIPIVVEPLDDEPATAEEPHSADSEGTSELEGATE
jgi:hypothetical protein